MLGGALALLLAGQASVSPGPDSVSVSIYRDPNRAPDAAMGGFLAGYALITETRQVRFSAGESELRFEGVASGIQPETAIVTGLPEGVIEKNQDAALLTPATLAAGWLGRPVTIRRTDVATGKTVERPALLRAASTGGGALLIESDAGVEAVHCTGLAEQLIFSSVPPGLSAQPTLSVRTRAQSAGTAMVTLSYLATSFDWRADYVAQLDAAGTTLDLFGWLTLASADETGFADAETLAIAGRPNRTQPAAPPRSPPQSPAFCYPTGPDYREVEPPMPNAPPPPPPPAPVSEQTIVVTASMMATREDLGDLKLYRVPERVTVAARSRKQVAFLDRAAVPVRLVHRFRADLDALGPAPLIVRMKNDKAGGLGLPLPSGRVALFAPAGNEQLLLGEVPIPDRATGEDVELVLSRPGAVATDSARVRSGKSAETVTLTVSNAGAKPVTFEAEFRSGGTRRDRFTGKLQRRPGLSIWETVIPANGSATLSWRERPPR